MLLVSTLTPKNKFLLLARGGWGGERERRWVRRSLMLTLIADICSTARRRKIRGRGGGSGKEQDASEGIKVKRHEEGLTYMETGSRFNTEVVKLWKAKKCNTKETTEMNIQIEKSQ